MRELIWKAWERFFTTTRSFLVRLLVQLAIASLAYSIAAIVPDPKAYAPQITFLAAVLLAVNGGMVLGLLFTALLGLAIDYSLTPPIGRVLVTAEDRHDFLFAIAVSVFTGLIVSSLRMAFQRSEIAKRDAEAAVRARDEIVGVVSHELRNPLTAVKTGVALIQQMVPASPETENARKLLERLRPSIDRMGLLVSDLLDVTRLEARALRLEVQACDLAGVIAETVRSYEPAAQENMIRLKVVGIPAPANVRCDPARTGQILANLVGNAIKFTNTGGEVRLSASELHDCIEVRVTDTGKGIPAELLPRVFDRFWQAPEASHRGAGLGLAIAKGLVEAQGGLIRVESRVGEGSTFIFTLPKSRAS